MKTPQTTLGGTDDRIRLMNVVTAFDREGPDRRIVDLGLTLDAQRFALEFGCLTRRVQFAASAEPRTFEMHEYPMPSLGSVRAAWQLLRLARRMSQRSIQIVHSYSFDANVFAIPAAWIAGTPVIVASIGDRGAHLTPSQRRLQRQTCRLADCVLVNAESIKEWLVQDGYDPGHVVIIRNGIDAGRFAVSRNPGVRAELGIPFEAPIVMMISRLIPMTGLEDFVDAAAFVSWHRPDVRFLIVGDETRSDHRYSSQTAYRQTIVDRIARLGLRDHVQMIGYRRDVPALLAETTVSVFPSLSEGSLNAILEAMAAGVPVVATRVGGTPEVIEQGHSGLLVPPADSQALADAMGAVVDDAQLAGRLGRAGRKAAIEHFSMTRMVQATEQLYLDLLVRKAAQPDWRRRIGLAPPAATHVTRNRS